MTPEAADVLATHPVFEPLRDVLRQAVPAIVDAFNRAAQQLGMTVRQFAAWVDAWVGRITRRCPGCGWSAVTAGGHHHVLRMRGAPIPGVQIVPPP